ncbi:hypothetical protein LJC08_00210 [Methanimicrococcus sp. OttesenSCG-928-J09]|nr:hypothetical protein [Methanimicrococcus sp. OttesenSCG-928-J09]
MSSEAKSFLNSLDACKLDEVSDFLSAHSDSLTPLSCRLESFIESESDLILRRPIELKIRYEDSLFIIENEMFNLFSYANNLKDALLDLERHFSFLWKEYAMEKDCNLTLESIQLKKKLNEYLEMNIV